MLRAIRLPPNARGNAHTPQATSKWDSICVAVSNYANCENVNTTRQEVGHLKRYKLNISNQIPTEYAIATAPRVELRGESCRATENETYSMCRAAHEELVGSDQEHYLGLSNHTALANATIHGLGMQKFMILPTLRLRYCEHAVVVGW
jgi:hypothetical protein